VELTLHVTIVATFFLEFQILQVGFGAIAAGRRQDNDFASAFMREADLAARVQTQ
jgi:hypothetical protein